MNKLSRTWINAIAVAAMAACFATTPARATQQAAAQPTENQDAKDIKAFVLDQTKFDQITASFGEIAACRKQNRAPWDTLTGDPAYTDASLTEKAKMMDAQVGQCTALLKKHNFNTRDYLISIDVLSRAEQVSLMKKRNMTAAAGKAAEQLNPASIAFTDAHYEEIEKWRQSIRTQAQSAQSQQARQAQPQQ
ncbi:MAG TPA: hypothetical protein VHP80_08480 [Candidatus Acidoferrum sp.]|nr:hypothetical protein [Candidatus Acidoferrum sp.]